jgi:hypothetical protein
MEVAPVEERHIHLGAAEGPGGVQPSESAAENKDPMCDSSRIADPGGHRAARRRAARAARRSLLTAESRGSQPMVISGAAVVWIDLACASTSAS